MKLEFYSVNNEYISYLRKFDKKVTNNKIENKNYGVEKLYTGILIEFEDFKYIAPLTSDKEEKLKIKKENTTFMKIYVKNEYKGSVNLNNMIPVNSNVIERVILNEIRIEKPKYADLLNMQLSFLQLNEKKLLKKAKTLHDIVTKGKNERFIKISCNFILLEEKSIEWGLLKSKIPREK